MNMPLILLLATVLSISVAASMASAPTRRLDSAADLHASVKEGKCKVCIERDYMTSGSVNMNFKDVKGGSNWNLERFDMGRHRDCTQEKIAHNRMLQMVQFFPYRGNMNCICGIQLACHDKIAMVEGAFVDLSGHFLTKHFNQTFPNYPPTKPFCSPDCFKLSEDPSGVKGMNVLRLAFSCYANDTACLHKNIEMW